LPCQNTGEQLESFDWIVFVLSDAEAPTS
jgi:hypothetical protein